MTEDGGSWPGASMSPKVSVQRLFSFVNNNLITTESHARPLIASFPLGGIS